MRPDDEAERWWREQCPERGAGLSHAHWSKCDGVHMADGTPMAGREHSWEMCCHCEMTFAMVQEMRDEMRLVGLEPGPVTSVPVEPPMAALNDDVPLGTCKADHSKMGMKVVRDGVVSWQECVLCGVQIEPKRATGQLPGPKVALGTGDLTKGQMAKLAGLRAKERFLDWLAAGRPPREEFPRG